MIKLISFNNNPTTAAAFFKLIDDNRAYLKQWLLWLDSTKQVGDMQAFLTQKTADDKNGLSFNYFIADAEGELIGTIGLSPHKEVKGRTMMVGYWVAKSHSGKGVATAALGEVIGIARKNAVQTLVLRCNPNNVGSNKVAQKNGFVFDHLLEQAENLYGELKDLNVYYLLLT